MKYAPICRRTALVCAAAATLTGCSEYGPKRAQDPAPAAPASGTPAESATGPALATLAEVPIGGGLILADEQVVLTQPEEGQVFAFDSTCTHAGCAVTEINDAQIECPCHGSRFGLDGSVVTGPATEPLAPITVVLAGDRIVRG